MKKAIIIIMIIAFIVPACAFCESPGMKFSTYGYTRDIKNIINGDAFSIDLYLFPEDLMAYIVTTIWKGSEVLTSVRTASCKTKTTDPKNIYLVFTDGSYYTCHYDEQYSYMIWLDLDGGSVRLRLADDLISGSDFKGQ